VIVPPVTVTPVQAWQEGRDKQTYDGKHEQLEPSYRLNVYDIVVPEEVAAIAVPVVQGVALRQGPLPPEAML
jgi:hypothetical protein